MPSTKKTELKVNINCERCKKAVLKAVTKLCGIDQVSVNAEKGVLTVIGDVDPVMIVEQVRKVRKCAEIISVGPPKPPEKKKSPKREKSPKHCAVLPPSCKQCQLVAVSFEHYGGGQVCNIL